MAYVAGLEENNAIQNGKRLKDIVNEAGFSSYKRFPHDARGKKQAEQYAARATEATGIQFKVWYTEPVSFRVF